MFTNYCEGLDQKHRQVACKLWDRVNLDEPGVRLTADAKRRLTAPRDVPPVDGGGPGRPEHEPSRLDLEPASKD